MEVEDFFGVMASQKRHRKNSTPFKMLSNYLRIEQLKLCIKTL